MRPQDSEGYHNCHAIFPINYPAPMAHKLPDISCHAFLQQQHVGGESFCIADRHLLFGVGLRHLIPLRVLHSLNGRPHLTSCAINVSSLTFWTQLTRWICPAIEPSALTSLTLHRSKYSREDLEMGDVVAYVCGLIVEVMRSQQEWLSP